MSDFRCILESTTAIGSRNGFFWITLVIFNGIFSAFFGMTIIRVSTNLSVMFQIPLTTFLCFDVDFFSMRLTIFAKCLIIFFRIFCLMFTFDVTDMFFVGFNIFSSRLTMFFWVCCPFSPLLSIPAFPATRFVTIASRYAKSSSWMKFTDWLPTAFRIRTDFSCDTFLIDYRHCLLQDKIQKMMQV